MISNTVLNQLPHLHPKAHAFTPGNSLEQPALPMCDTYVPGGLPAAKAAGSGTGLHLPYTASLVYGTDGGLEHAAQVPTVTT